MSKMFWVRNFLKTGSSLVASASIAISILSLPLLNSSKALADYSFIGASADLNNALQDLYNKGINPTKIAFAPNGGWVIIYNNYQFIQYKVRQDFLNKLLDLNRQQLNIDSIAFTSTGEWVIAYGYYGNNIATSQNLPLEAVTALSDIKTKDGFINAMAFSPNGSFVFVYSRNGYSVSKNISPEIVADLEAIKTQNHAVTDIAFNTDGSFIVIYGGSGAYRTQGIPQSLIDEINRINKNSINNPSTAYKTFTGVGLTSNTWVLLYRNVL
ncbi:MAG: WD40 repeat domain-containing protein [Rhizonema sp. PD37]|nr:WD40 repeat domain-containing protein [Rhizonema sp. PD37]